MPQNINLEKKTLIVAHGFRNLIHAQLNPWQEHYGRRAWGSRDAYYIAAGKQRRGTMSGIRGPGTEYMTHRHTLDS